MLDPSAGTCGFLISGYKHILNSNTNKTLGDKLTPDERKKLMNNVTGYDISPDMVRLSLVNLFLHGFSNPKVYEYDTLTSEDRWNEYYDVVLANPPFMTPKGGIRPHKRFGIQSNRAEVLFVDYIMEHLTPKGRAGIVVPEGIIFQSGTAYKSLRKSLIEKYLVGVISLPSGVFNPYSGVKTSILILDRELNQKTDKIFFVKVENDGFDLGAQRREIERNDLPIITNEVTEYLNGLRNGKEVESENLNFVPKEQILGSNDIGLSYDRYSVKDIRMSSFPVIKIGEVCQLTNGYAFKSEDLKPNKEVGLLPVIKIGNLTREGKIDTEGIQYHSYNETLKKYLLKQGDILIAMTGATTGKVSIIEDEGFLLNQRVGSIRINEDGEILNNYLKQLLFSNHFYEYCQSNAGGGAQGNISPSQILEYQIPLPPLDVQEEIVQELEQYQKIIDGAKQVVDNYKPVIDIDPNWEMKELGEVCEFKRGPFGGSLKKEIFVKEGYLVYEQYHAINDDTEYGRYYVSTEKYKEMESFSVQEDDLLISCSGTMGKITKIKKNFIKGIINQALLRLRLSSYENSISFVKIYLESQSIQEKYFRNQNGAAIQNVMSVKDLKQIPFPNIDIEIQKSIVDKIESERHIIEGNKKLIEIYTQKIQDRINKIWGE